MTTCLITLSEGHWHHVPAPGPDALRLGEMIEGFAAVVDIDETRRTVRLVTVLRGQPCDFILWCRRSGFRPIGLPAAAPAPAALAARPRPTL